MDIKEKITGVFDAIQGLEIKATPNNVKILDAVYDTLKDIYAELSKEAGEEHASG